MGRTGERCCWRTGTPHPRPLSHTSGERGDNQGFANSVENEFGLSSQYALRIAHFSYQIAESYHVKRLGAALEQFAVGQRPFCVKTTGLALFTGVSPVLYIPVVRGPELTRLHTALWQALDGAGTGVSGHYDPENWMPHITLAQGDISNHNLPQIMRFLSGRDLTWEIAVNNIAFIAYTGENYRLKFRFGFGTRENDHQDYN